MFSWRVLTVTTIVSVFLFGSVIEGAETMNKIDFVLVVDRSPPFFSHWKPSHALVNSSRLTEKIHAWSQAVVKKLLEDAQAKNVDGRLSVVVVFENNVTKVDDFYSKDHTPSKKYILRELRFAYVRTYSKRLLDTPLIVGRMKNITASTKPESRRFAPEMVIMQIPFDGDDTRAVQAWQLMHLQYVDLMLGLWDYWNMDLNPTRIVVARRTQFTDPFLTTFNPKNPSVDQKLAESVWNFVHSCRTVVNYSQCYMDSRKSCLMDRVYIPQAISGSWDIRQCGTGTEVISCLYGQDRCERQCFETKRTHVQIPCNVTCGCGGTEVRKHDPNDRSVKHCPPKNFNCCRTCDGRSTATVTQFVVSQTTTSPLQVDNWENGTTEVLTVEGIRLQAWMIAVIAIACLIFLTIVISIIVYCARKPDKRRSRQDPGAGGRFGRRGPSGATSRTGRSYFWSHRLRQPQSRVETMAGSRGTQRRR